MQNLKIRVNNDNASEVIDLLVILGHKTIMPKGKLLREVSVGNNQIVNTGNGLFTTKNHYDVEEITLPELRAMVNPMKEYLDANRNYEFVISSEKEEGFIEIPEGAEAFGYTGIVHTFYKDDFRSFFNENTDGQWDERSETWVGRKEPVILWQREQDEPFLTPETTLNDQYAEIEEVRKHNHYFKDVSNLNEIDVYMVLKLFNVTDPCLQHIAKKALCAGQRGHKDFTRDLKDILDTAKRAVEINN